MKNKLIIGIALCFMAAAALADTPSAPPPQAPSACTPVCIGIPFSGKYICIDVCIAPLD